MQMAGIADRKCVPRLEEQRLKRQIALSGEGSLNLIPYTLEIARAGFVLRPLKH